MHVSHGPQSDRTHLESPVVAPVLRTPRLILRPHRMSDAADWLRIEQDPRVRDGLHWPVRDERQMMERLRARTLHTRLWQVDDFLALAIERDGVVIGDVSMHLRDAAPGSRTVEMGWLLRSQHGGRGYATEAAQSFLGFAFHTLEVRWVSAVIDVGNERSIALARRLGFVRVAQSGRKATFLIDTAPLDGLDAIEAATPAAECIRCELDLCSPS